MCAPGAASMATIPLQLGMMLLGERDESEAKKTEARENKALADRAADDAILRGGKEAALLRTQASETISAQKVAFNSSGVDASVGTPASLAEGTRAMGELDAQTMENNAAREAWGFRTHGLKFQAQAALESRRSANRMAGMVLTSAGRYADSVDQANTAYKERG